MIRLTLNQDELEALKKAESESQDVVVHKKITAIRMLHLGYLSKDIAECLGLTTPTIHRYYHSYKKHDLSTYLSTAYKVYQGKLTEEMIDKLREHLNQNLYSKAEDVQAYVFKEFGIKYSLPGISVALNRLGYRYKLAGTVPMGANKEDQDRFLEQTLNPLLEKAKNKEVDVYFVDSTHPCHQATAGRAWIPVGKNVSIPSGSGRKRVNITGAINAVEPTDLHYEKSKTVNSETIVSVLKKNKGEQVK
jgi:transposase